ncbi:MAG: sulfatase, partial [Bryobacteraceae bacterium]
MSCSDHLYRGKPPQEITRRWFFEQCGVGLGRAALGSLMAGAALAAPSKDPLAAKPPQFPAKAKRVIYLFMAGAPSH